MIGAEIQPLRNCPAGALLVLSGRASGIPKSHGSMLSWCLFDTYNSFGNTVGLPVGKLFSLLGILLQQAEKALYRLETQRGTLGVLLSFSSRESEL